MVFSSYAFLTRFLPAVLVTYYLLSRVKNSLWQRVFLIAASLFFYACDHPSYLLLIAVSMAGNYAAASGIHRLRGNGRTRILSLGVLFNLLLLGYFKYLDFLTDTVNRLTGSSFPLRRIALPLGISFFTFQQISFLVSVWRGEERVERLRDYCLFVTFFPQLVAGPIVLYGEMIPQFKDQRNRFFHAPSFAEGIYIFSIGLFKKAVLADTLALLADNGFSMEAPGLAAAWAASLSYTLQIYFDFSGYSDMAVGLGRLFNIRLPFNFRSPYQSESVTEFWRRWHITLGRALRTFVYIPLGGSRRGLARTCGNLLVTFFLSGLWHGAGWTFVLWGLLHGVCMVLERLAGDRLRAVPRPLRTGGTFLVVNALWVLFRAETFSQAAAIYRGMLSFSRPGLRELASLAYDSVINFPAVVDIAYVALLLAGLLLVVFRCRNSAERLDGLVLNRRSMLEAAVLFSVSVLCLSRNSVFIYFNF